MVGLDKVGGFSGFEVKEGLDLGGKAVFWGGIGAHSDFAEEASGLGDEEGFNPEVILWTSATDIFILSSLSLRNFSFCKMIWIF